MDQAGFRSVFACDDHLQKFVLLIEKLRKYNLPLWCCAVDFKKACDSVEHMALWRAVAEQGVSSYYIKLLARLYEGQVGHINCRLLSKEFPIQRRVKQGDPLSPALFNAALEDVIRKVQPIWRQKGWGIQTGKTGKRSFDERSARR